MSKRYLIIADDFTGANDTGVQLCKRGIDTEVLFAGKPLAADISSIVIDTESRTILPEAADKSVRIALEKVDFSQFDYVMKKIDSTIRGNIVEECRAVCDYYKPEIIVCAPALPVLGRTTENGIQHLNGVRICETEVAKDPINPVCEDNLVNILTSICKDKVVLKTVKDVNSPDFCLCDGNAFVCDAKTSEDLDRVVAAAIKTNKKVLYIGTAGLAGSIINVENPVYPAFGVVASVSSVINKQMHYCEKAGTTLIQLPMDQILSGKVKAEDFRDSAISSLKAGKDTILLTDTAYDRSALQKSLDAFNKLGMGPVEAGKKVRDIVGALAIHILEKVKVSGVFLSGGDTAQGIIKQIDADGSQILLEALPGIPIMRVCGGKMNGLKLSTKAGAFGTEEAVLIVMGKLKENI